VWRSMRNGQGIEMSTDACCDVARCEAFVGLVIRDGMHRDMTWCVRCLGMCVEAQSQLQRE
jgi:hypothetical protein